MFIANNDSLKSLVYYLNDFSIPVSFTEVDTSLLEFHRYDPISKGDFIKAGTGNLGMPHHSLVPSIESINSFSIGEDRLTDYMFTPQNIPYYQLKIPYSNISYVMGPREENYLDFTLGNQISKGLYFGTDLRFEACKGSFNNQRATNNHFRTVVISSSRDEKYKLVFNYLRNRFKFGENGGLVNDSYYEDTTRIDRRLLSVNLPNALDLSIYSQNLLLSNQFIVNQYYNFGDSNLNLGGLFLDFDYITKNRIYSDRKNFYTYYNHNYIDTLQSFDSTSNQSIKAFMGWQRFADSLGFSFKAGIEGSYNQFYTGEGLLNVFNYLNPRIFLSYTNTKALFKIEGNYQILQSHNGLAYNNNSFSLKSRFSHFINSNLKYDLGFKYISEAPQFSTFKTYSNHFIWQNSFINTNSVEFNSLIDLKGYKLSGTLMNLQNHVWYNENVIPIQSDTGINILRVAITKRFNMRNFGSDIYGAWQKVDNNEIYRLPEFIARANIFFNFPMFNGVLQVFPGLELTYISSYYADGYNPSNMVFYVQNERKIDDQINLDFFVNFKIKRARIFVMYKGLNMLFGKYNYFHVAHYPQQDSALKFGVSWRFYD